MIRLHQQSDGTIVAATWQDVEPVLERNKAVQGERLQDEFWRWIGSIPAVIITQWLYEEYDRGNTQIKWTDREFEQIIMRKLRDPDYRWLRTGKL